jgi:manganese transport protein
MAPPDYDASVASLDDGMMRGGSLPEVFRSVKVPQGGRFWSRLLAFAGPGYLVAVGYMDPGNWATDLAGGSQFGYALLPVILFSGLAAIFLQWLALRLGIASGMDLARACRQRFSPAVSRFLWITCEIAIAACDLAEVLGSAIALNLLFNLPLFVGVCLTAFDALLVLGLQKRGFRYLEAFVIALVGIIAACFLYELACCGPDLAAIAAAMKPSGSVFSHHTAVYLSLGIFGATVMPHNLYLHSAIVQTRDFERTDKGKREAIKFSTIDCVAALAVALLINASILILAAATFHKTGHTDVAEIQDAYKLLSPIVGPAAASILFAVALLAAGQNSTVTGTMAGQIVMEGFLSLKMNPALRRLLTRGIALVPALIVTAIAGESGAAKLLIFSQVVLSMQLGFAVIPLVMFTSDRKLMGDAFANGIAVKAAGFGLSALIVAVNLWLIIQTFLG